MSLKTFEWSDKYSVEIEEIDNQHKKLFKAIDRFQESLNKNEKEKAMRDVLTELLEYTKIHFTTEEQYFRELNYPGAETHKIEHEKFINKIESIYEKLDNGELVLSLEITNYLRSWLRGHIQVTDRKYTDFFHKKGIK